MCSYSAEVVLGVFLRELKSRYGVAPLCFMFCVVYSRWYFIFYFLLSEWWDLCGSFPNVVVEGLIPWYALCICSWSNYKNQCKVESSCSSL